VVGYLAAGLPEGSAPFLPLFHAGLKETGYTDGRNVAMEYRWAAGRHERLTSLASELVALKVAVIVAINPQTALAAKKATQTTPEVVVEVTYLTWTEDNLRRQVSYQQSRTILIVERHRRAIRVSLDHAARAGISGAASTEWAQSRATKKFFPPGHVDHFRRARKKPSVRRMAPDRLLQHLIRDILSGTVNDC
jgi:ABC transporter substrate binding protein